MLKQLLHLNSGVCWWRYTYAEVTALYLHTYLLTTEQVFWSCFLTSSLKMVGVILLEGASMRRRARFCPSASTIPRCQAAVTLSLEKILQGALRVLFKCMACTKLIVRVSPCPFFFLIRKWLTASGMEKQKCCIRRKNASYYYLTFWHTRRRLLNRYILEVCEICMWVYVCFLGDTSTFNDVQLHIIITH